MTTVNDLYTTVLGRSGSADEIASWDKIFGSDTPTYSQGMQFLNSAQNELNQRAQNWSGGDTNSLYATFLNRPAEQAGADFWNNKLGTSVDSNEAYQFLQAAQPEYQKKIRDLFDTTNQASPTGTNNLNTGGIYATPGVVNFNSIGTTQAPTAPTLQSVQTPEWYNTYNQMYQNTFTNPQQYWNEYSQGVGAQNMEAAARGMAQSGRTGLLPTLQTDAYKGYMSDYLPTVREGIAKGLTYDQGMNQVLGNMYNNQLDYNKGIYGSQVSAYGAQLGLDQAKLSAISNAQDQNTKLAIAQLDSLSKQYGVDAQTQQQIYQSMSNMFPHMTTEDQNAFVNEMKLAMGINASGNSVGQDQTQIPQWYKDIQAQNGAEQTDAISRMLDNSKALQV